MAEDQQLEDELSSLKTKEKEKNTTDIGLATFSSHQVLQNINHILAHELMFEDITPNKDSANDFTKNKTETIDHLRKEYESTEYTGLNEDMSQEVISEKVILPEIASNSQEQSFGDDIHTVASEDKDNVDILRSRHNSTYTGETDLEDSFYNIPDTRSNTESFSELRFSVSETHSESNYSESEPEISKDVMVSKLTDEFNLLEQFPDLCDYQKSNIDDTTGILYKMSEQINKVPLFLEGLNKQADNISELTESKFNDAAPVSETSDTLEERVFRYFSQCDKLSPTGQDCSKGSEELGRLEAAVERMLNQVEIQENLLKEDVSFVPLVLDKREVKAIPLLVDTLCLSPQVQRKRFQRAQPNVIRPAQIFNNEKKTFSSSIPNILRTTYLNENDAGLEERSTKSCSISELERSVNRLLSEVEKEEEKLCSSSSDSRNTYMSTTSATDVSSEDDSTTCVWWEGAYRSLPRHPARKRLSKTSSYQKLLKPPQSPSCSQSHTSDDSDTSKESVRLLEKSKQPLSKLVVRTVESGKTALEIRTCNEPFESTKEKEGSKFCKMFKKRRSGAHSVWNRSLPSLHYSPLFPTSMARSLGSDDSINYVKYLEPSECIQYITPSPTMHLDSSGYCTWTQKLSGGESAGEETSKSPIPPTAREGDEALMDLAAGVQDPKGTGHSGTK